jgi:hypothetical protein
VQVQVQVRVLEPAREPVLVQELAQVRVRELEPAREPVLVQELAQELAQERVPEREPVLAQVLAQALVQEPEQQTPSPGLPTAAAITQRLGIWATGLGRSTSRPMMRAIRRSRSANSSIRIRLIQTETTRSPNGRREIGIRLCVFGRCLTIRSFANG